MRFVFIGAHYHALRRELRDLGHECFDIDHWHLFNSGMNMEEANEQVRKEAIRLKPHVLIMWKGWSRADLHITPVTIQEIKRATGCKTGYWCVDDPDFLGFATKHLMDLGTWDFALTCCRASVDAYRAAGIEHAYYFIPGHDTEWPVDDLEAWKDPPTNGNGVRLKVEFEAVDLVIIGHPYWHTAGADLGRAQLAVAALEAGLTVEIYGPQRDTWVTDTRPHLEKQGVKTPFLCGDPALSEAYCGWIDHEQVWRGMKRGKVVFNNHLRKGGGYDKRYTGYCNDKIAQILGSGCCMLMDYQPGMDDVITPGVHYLEYRPSLDWRECLESAMDLLKEIVKDDKRRYSIAKAGQQHILDNHTWGHRASELVDISTGRQR